jgi:hypothetical protein
LVIFRSPESIRPGFTIIFGSSLLFISHAVCQSKFFRIPIIYSCTITLSQKSVVMTARDNAGGVGQTVRESQSSNREGYHWA